MDIPRLIAATMEEGALTVLTAAERALLIELLLKVSAGPASSRPGRGGTLARSMRGPDTMTMRSSGTAFLASG